LRRSIRCSSNIIAIILTIIFTQENQKRERKLSIKPHLQTEYHPIFNTEKAKKLVSDRAIFIMYSHDENDESEIISSTYEPPYLLQKSKTEDPQKNIIRELAYWRKYYITKYSVSNVGAGNALNLSFTINNKPVISPFSLTVNGTKVFVIIFKAELLKEKERPLYFKFEYQDVASIAKYNQHETIILFASDNGSLNSKQDMNNIISQPEEM